MNHPSYFETAENLQLKLSLKKQIWTGIENHHSERLKPLSWGAAPMIRKKTHLVDAQQDLLM